MKHSSRITIILILVFLVAQIFGLFTVNSYIQVEVDESGEIIVAHPDTAIGEIPELEGKEKGIAFIPIIVTVLLGTMLLFLLIKLGWGFIFKYWFLLAILVSLAVTFEVYFSKIFNPTISIVSAFVLGLIFAIWKVFRPNVYIHNITEVFTYTGIAIIFSGFLNLNSAILLLL